MSALPTAKYRLKAIPVKFLPTTRLTELQQTTLKRVRTHRRLHTAGALLRKLRDGGGTLQLETVLQSDDAGLKTDTHIHRTGCPETHSYSRQGGQAAQRGRRPLQQMVLRELDTQTSKLRFSHHRQELSVDQRAVCREHKDCTLSH